MRYGADKNEVWKITKGNNSRNIKHRVMVLVHCTSPQWDLSTYEISVNNESSVNSPYTLWEVERIRIKYEI